MQKCPKCGTILDDSKKQCYMCGTILKEENGNSFAEALGLIEPTQKKPENKPTPAQNDFSDNTITFFSDEINKLNSLDNQNINQSIAQEGKKIQDNKDKNNKDNKKNVKLAHQKNKSAPLKERATTPTTGKFFGQNDNTDYQETVRMALKIEKKDDYKNSYKNIKLEKPSKPKIKIKFSQVFNIVCVVAFVVVVVLAAKYFFKPKDSKNNLGGLIFKVDERFELASSDGSNRYYKYKDNCSIRLMYGQSSGGDEFIDNYLESQKAEFEKQENNQTMIEQLSINGNSWKALSIINLVPISDSDEYDHFIKYKYVSIFHNGNFYHTVFVNANDDKTCKDMYDEFTSTLVFE